MVAVILDYLPEIVRHALEKVDYGILVLPQYVKCRIEEDRGCSRKGRQIARGGLPRAQSVEDWECGKLSAYQFDDFKNIQRAVHCGVVVVVGERKKDRQDNNDKDIDR